MINTSHETKNNKYKYDLKFQCLSQVPYLFGADNNTYFLMDKKESKPSYASNENPKTINDVYPEKIAAQVLNSLDIKHNLDKIQTKHGAGAVNLDQVSEFRGALRKIYASDFAFIRAIGKNLI